MGLLGLGRLGLEGALGHLHQFVESGVIGGGDIGEHLTVDADLGGFEAFHEAAVGEACGAGGGVDSDLPEAAEVALFVATIAVGVLAAVVDSVGGVAIEFRTAEAVALGGLQHALAAFPGSWGVCDTHGMS